MTSHRAGAFAVVASLSILSAAGAQTREELQAQEAAAPLSDDRPRVFLDCVDGCFQDYLRTEITFVDYVRDRAGADVHVLVTTQETGAGGREYGLRLIGQGRFGAIHQTVRHVTEKNEPEERVRRGVAQALKLGLVSYLAQTSLGPQITISSSAPKTAPRARKDPWNSWVFSLRGSGDIEGEEASTQYWAQAAVGADRITPDWKISLGASASHEEDRFDVDGREVVSTKVFRNGEVLAIRSLGPNWSAGAHGALWKNTFENTRIAAGFGPMLEYSLFPYDQYTRRQLRVSYRLELRNMHYVEQTLFEKAEEVLWREEIEVNLQRREPWGSVEGELDLSHYLHDLGKYRAELRLEASLRLIRGLSLNIGAEGSRVRDQLSLPRRGATAEEILLEQRQLASGFRYEANIGLTYTFGSIYNNVVNPRFGD